MPGDPPTAGVFGAIEAGGTKFQCAVARGIDALLASRRIATTTPAETLRAVVEFFVEAQRQFGRIEAFGVGAFGPVDLDRRSATYGRLLPTPKVGWSGADLLGPLAARFGRPIGLDTDVNAAALAEAHCVAGQTSGSLAYVTVGTGIGGGLVIGGHPLHGVMHPEMGHIPVRRDARAAAFAGICPVHGDCREGLACGPALAARWGAPRDRRGGQHPAADIIGGYLGQLAATLALVTSCERVVFGGGVMSGGALLPRVRVATERLLAGYLPGAPWRGGLERFITAPVLGERSGIIGALRLAQEATLRPSESAPWPP